MLGRDSSREVAMHPIRLDALSPEQLTEFDYLYYASSVPRVRILRGCVFAPDYPVLCRASSGCGRDAGVVR